MYMWTTGHVLKPETTKRKGRNETTETSEKTETSKNKNEKVKKYDLYLAPTIDPRVWHIVTPQILAVPVKMNEHKQDEHEDIEKKLDIFHILNGILKQES